MNPLDFELDYARSGGEFNGLIVLAGWFLFFVMFLFVINRFSTSSQTASRFLLIIHSVAALLIALSGLFTVPAILGLFFMLWVSYSIMSSSITRIK